MTDSDSLILEAVKPLGRPEVRSATIASRASTISEPAVELDVQKSYCMAAVEDLKLRTGVNLADYCPTVRINPRDRRKGVREAEHAEADIYFEGNKATLVVSRANPRPFFTAEFDFELNSDGSVRQTEGRQYIRTFNRPGSAVLGHFYNWMDERAQAIEKGKIAEFLARTG